MKDTDNKRAEKQRTEPPENSTKTPASKQDSSPIPVAPKKMDVGSEALLGALNGVVVGGALSAAGSIAYSFAKNATQNTTGKVFSNITGAHLGVVLGSTAAITVINALVRSSHAMQRNTWCDKVDTQLQTGGYAQKISEESKNPLPKQL